MASHPPADPRPSLFESPSGKADENEITGYRAVSPLAVLSVVLGAASILCFLDLSWLALPAISVVAGLLAIRKIRKSPESTTGHGFAQAGMVMALSCALSSYTYSEVVRFQIRRETAAVGRQFAEALNSRKLTTAAWFFVLPEMRRGIAPQDVDVSVEKMRKGSVRFMDSGEVISQVLKVLEDPAAHAEFVDIERTTYLENVARGGAVIRIEPGGQEAMAYIRTPMNARGSRQYYIELLEFPRSKPNVPANTPYATTAAQRAEASKRR